MEIWSWWWPYDILFHITHTRSNVFYSICFSQFDSEVCTVVNLKTLQEHLQGCDVIIIDVISDIFLKCLHYWLCAFADYQTFCVILKQRTAFWHVDILCSIINLSSSCIFPYCNKSQFCTANNARLSLRSPLLLRDCVHLLLETAFRARLLAVLWPPSFLPFSSDGVFHRMNANSHSCTVASIIF